MGEKYTLMPKRISQPFSSFFNEPLIDFTKSIMNKNYEAVLKGKNI